MRLMTELLLIGGNIFFGSDIIGTVFRIVHIVITDMIACLIIDNRIVEGTNQGFGRACKGDAHPCPAKAVTLITKL
jgi:hypothetical protein